MAARSAVVSCPCGHSFEVPAESAESETLCPACGRTFTPAPRIAVDPDLVPGYRILQRIGSGGMGEVYLARQGSLDRTVAIKLLPPVLGQDREYVQRFLKEARSAGKLGHENIVAAVDVGEAGGRYFFVMEYVKGDTLYRTIKREGRIPEGRALDYARQIARGLRHAYQNGLIHRDIKPKNIIVTAEGTVKICDFGLARELSGEGAGKESSEEAFSSPAYASPEQCLLKGSLDHRSDMYSLGVTLFEMLTGRRPFGGATPREMMDLHIGKDPPSPLALNPSLSMAAGQLVLRLLRKEPDQRFKDYDELIAAIEAAGKLPAARPTVRTPRGTPAPRKVNPLPWVLAGAGFAIAVTVMMVTLLTRGRRHEPPPAPDEGPAAAAPAADAEIERLLEETQRFQDNAAGNPLEVSAVRAKWRHLMERYRGTPHQPLFAARLVEFESRVRADADQAARKLMEEAEEEAANGRPMEALKILARFPPAYAGTEAATRVAGKALEVERAVDDRFAQILRDGERLVSGERFEEARSFLKALKEQVSQPAYPRPRHLAAVDGLLKRLGEAEAQARARKPKPAPDAPGPDPKPPLPGPARVPSGPIHFLVLRSSEERADAARRAAAAAVFAEMAAKSSFYRAAALFLSRDDRDWKLGPAGTKAIEEYFLSPTLAAAETITPAQHLMYLKLLSRGIASIGEEPADAFQLFACAHLDEILARGGKADPAAMKEARLESAAFTDLWGLPGSLGRVEMAMILARPAAGIGILRAAEAAANSPDVALRLLGALCAFKGPPFDLAAAAERWRKVAAGANDPALARFCEAVADRLKQSTSCEACSGQGRHPCGFCAATGSAPCAPCQGVGFTLDEEGGRKTCAACKSKALGPCAGCGGARSMKCEVCEGKRYRALMPGGQFRYLIDLGRCSACSGTGSVFPRAAYPCAACGAVGRHPERMAKEFSQLPPWVKTREGRTLFNALRWLARHPNGKGFWTPSPCRLCDPAPVAYAHDVGATSLALMAFLAAGFDPASETPMGDGTAGEAVRRGLDWLVAQQQPDGHVVHGLSVKPMYEHLLALNALCAAAAAIGPGGAYGEKERAALREASIRALRFALTHQDRSAGWGYLATPPSTDTWVTSWGAMGLLAAREAGMEVPRANLSWILQWLDSVTDRADFHIGYTPAQMGKVGLTGAAQYYPHETLSASGSLVRMYVEGKGHPSFAAADKFVLRDLPNPDPLRRDYCWWYWGTAYLAHRQQRKGADWNHWTAALVRELMAAQDSRDLCTLGSWPPNDRWSLSGGRTYATAMNALTLSWASGLKPLLKLAR